MPQQPLVPVLSAEALQQLCDECKSAIHSQSNGEVRLAMQKVCDKCTGVRENLPKLAELHRQLHEMNERFSE